MWVVVRDIEVENEFSAAIETLVGTNDKFKYEEVALVAENGFARRWKV